MEYKQTLNMGKSGFPMRAGLPAREPAMLENWEKLDLYNELLKKNAENLKMATVETAKQMERGVVDIETLEHTNQMLISTIDEVMQIQDEGRQKREAAEATLQKMEDDLKNKLMEITQ